MSFPTDTCPTDSDTIHPFEFPSQCVTLAQSDSGQHAFVSVSSTANGIRPGVRKKSFCVTDSVCEPPNSHPVQSVGFDSHDSLCGAGSRPLPQVPTADSSHPFDNSDMDFELEEDPLEDND